MDRKAIEKLSWWKEQLATWNEKNIPPTMVIEMDASLRAGVQCVVESKHKVCSHRWSNESISMC